MSAKNLIFIISLTCGLLSISPEIAYSDVSSPLPPPAFPSLGAAHQTSKILTSINSHGIIGATVYDPKGFQLVNGFYLPYTEEIQYLNNAALWVGGIVAGDTLVSVSYSKEIRFVSKYGGRQTIYEYELYPPYARDSLNAITNYNRDGTEINHLNLTDTIWSYIPPTYTIYRSNLDYDHWPMGLEITQKSYSKNISPYKNIVLFDYTITNISDEVIDQLSVGLYLDADICGDCVDTFSVFNLAMFDDMVGSIREMGIGYMIDNDGDPSSTYQFNKYSPLDAIAVRPLFSSAPMSDTSFNWWGAGVIDYGPRRSDLTYPDFGGYTEGTPPYDRNKFFVMNNGEWDYDQVDILNLPQTDPNWEIPAAEIAADYYNGYDGRFLLSLSGPALKPDSSLRIIFGIFGAEYIHIDPYNAKNLAEGKTEAYKANLFKNIIISNGLYAENFAKEILNPKLPPLGLQQSKAIADSIYLQWDCWSFDDVTGYRLYYKPLPDSLVLAPGIPLPNICWDDINDEEHMIESASNKLVISGLVPGRMYLAAVAHQTIEGEGGLSEPIIIGGYNSELMVFPPITDYDFTTLYRDNDTVQITWDDPNYEQVDYYKIYRTTDSIFAAHRYQPFVASDEYQPDYLADVCLDFHDSTYCLYCIPAYDSMPVAQFSAHQFYNDSLPVPSGIYWVSAVSKAGFESGFSDLVFTVEDFEPFREIVVVMGSSFAETDYAYADSIINFYDRILEGYTYDIFNWYDSNLIIANCSSQLCTHPNDIASYKNVIIEEFPTPYLMSRQLEYKYGFFTQVALMGRNVIYFGTPPGTDLFTLNTVFNEIDYPEKSFQHSFMGLDSIWIRPWQGSYNILDVHDSLAGFHQALPVTDQPPLTVKNSDQFYKPLMKNLFNLENIAPMTPAFFPGDSSEVLYTYHSNFPETSELEALPCGIKTKPFRAKVYSFPFHLWAIEESDARNLIDYVIADAKNNPSPAELPEQFKLAQNYPNPFNPTTQIEFELPRKSLVTLEVFNILGQKVKTILNNENLPSGTYIREWNGKDDANQTVATGIYLYRLSTDEFSSSKKMLLLK